MSSKILANEGANEHDVSHLADEIKRRLEQAQREKVKNLGPGKPIFVDSKWVSSSDYEWAEKIGIYVYPKGFTSEGGITVLAPELSRALETNLPFDKKLTAQDVAIGILMSIVSSRPDLGGKDLIRAYAIVSTHVGLQDFPHLIRPFAPKGGKLR